MQEDFRREEGEILLALSERRVENEECSRERSCSRLLIAAGLFGGAHFGLCYIIPQSGPGSFLFPFGNAELQGGVDTTLFGDLRGIGMAVMIGVAGLAVLAFCAGFLANLDWYVPTIYLRQLILTGAVLSCAIYLPHLGTRALVPLAVDAALIYAMTAGGWARVAQAG